MTTDDAYHEALRRIEEADRTKAEILDLGDLPLDRLPNELARLTNLRVLALGIESPRFADDQIHWTLDLSRTNQSFRDLTAIAVLANLQQLDLRGANLMDVGPFSKLANL